MKLKTLIIVMALFAVTLCSCGQALSEKESLAASCVEDLKTSLVSQRTLELTDDVTFESYLFTDDVGSNTDADYNELTVIDNAAYREYVIIPYAASNAMGVMIDNVAYYKVRLNESGNYEFKYIGDNNDLNDWQNIKDHKDISLFYMDRDVDSPASTESISADVVAKEVGCTVNK